jgi:DNA-binding LacI/PurR family transcriptional regulator
MVDGLDVPGDVSVVGYDDSSVARLATVDLTSVSQAPHAMPEAAVDAAVERLEGSRILPADVVLSPQLMVRSTTDRPASHRS